MMHYLQDWKHILGNIGMPVFTLSLLMQYYLTPETHWASHSQRMPTRNATNWLTHNCPLAPYTTKSHSLTQLSHLQLSQANHKAHQQLVSWFTRNTVLTYQFQQQPLLILQYFLWLYWGSLFLAGLCFSVQPNECYQTVTALAKYTNSQGIWLFLSNHMAISSLMFLSMLSPRVKIVCIYGAFDFSEEFLIKISTAVAKKQDW